MRIAYLIAGAGDMYCGSCLRDNRLAATLLADGREVVVVPLYTPLRTDETEVRSSPIRFGGINVYLQNLSSLFGRVPAFVDRLLDSPALLRRVGKFAAGTRPERLGPLTVAMLRGYAGPLKKELSKLIVQLAAIQPTLVNLPDLMFAGVAEPLREALRCPIVCTLAGEDVFLDALPEPYRAAAFDCVRRAAAHIDAFIAPTRYYAEHAARHFGLPASRIHYVPLGISLKDIPRATHPPDSPFTIGYFARICPEKGLANLVEAFITLRSAGHACRLRAGGYLATPDKPYLAALTRCLDEHHVGADFEYVGSPDRAGKLAFLASLHVFSVPTVYHEAKGLYLLEALACGTPVVQPNHGAFPELIEATGGGLLYDASAPPALAEALVRCLTDADLRRRLAAAGKNTVQTAFTDQVMADRTWTLYQQLLAR